MRPELQDSLRKAVAPFTADADLEIRSKAAMTLAVEGAELPAAVEVALNGFLEQATEGRLRALQAAVVSSGELGIGAASFVELAVGLAVHSLLPMQDVAGALASVPHADRSELSPEQMHLAEVADAVVEDSRDGFMEVAADDLFARAVRACWESRPDQ